MKDYEIYSLMRTLESFLVYSKENWKRFQADKGGRGSDADVEYYSFLKNELANSITKLARQVGQLPK